jgi:hypothetical protein
MAGVCMVETAVQAPDLHDERQCSPAEEGLVPAALPDNFCSSGWRLDRGR